MPRLHVRSYQDLESWQRAMDFLVACYRLAAELPASERYALSSQFRRAAASIPANIAEGHSRRFQREFARYLAFSVGSLAEVETYLLAAVRLGYFTADKIEPAASLGRQLGRLINALRKAVVETSSQSTCKR